MCFLIVEDIIWHVIRQYWSFGSFGAGRVTPVLGQPQAILVLCLPLRFGRHGLELQWSEAICEVVIAELRHSDGRCVTGLGSWTCRFILIQLCYTAKWLGPQHRRTSTSWTWVDSFHHAVQFCCSLFSVIWVFVVHSERDTVAIWLLFVIWILRHNIDRIVIINMNVSIDLHTLRLFCIIGLSSALAWGSTLFLLGTKRLNIVFAFALIWHLLLLVTTIIIWWILKLNKRRIDAIWLNLYRIQRRQLFAVVLTIVIILQWHLHYRSLQINYSIIEV